MISEELRTSETKYTKIEEVFSIFGYIRLIRVKTCYKSNYGRWKSKYRVLFGWRIK